ncbi:MAG: phosphomannomutase/phosphoglucomutase [Planctomycetota bacterium]
MLGRVFKAYDIRGIYPDLLDEAMAWQIGYGVGKYLLEEAAAKGETSPMMRNLVVGRDMRTSSPSLQDELVKGINSYDADVIDVGLVDTPFIYFAINYLGCAGGVQVTASHNPPQYNGFKVSRALAKPVGEANGLADIRKHAAMTDKGAKRPQPTGRREHRDLWDAYTQHVRSFINTHGKKLKVVIDASNGMAGTAVPKIFGAKGAAIDGLEIIELNFDNSKGEFVHEPNPLVASNLVQLQEAVKEHKADLGVCFDGDADRCVIVDEQANIVGCDLLTAVLAKRFLAKHPGAAIVYDLRSTRALSEDVEQAGGKPVRSRVGHVFMKSELAEQRGIFGGELSGHFYFRDNFNADSGVIALATVLSTLAEEDKPMSHLVAPVARYTQSGEINFENEEADEALEELTERFAEEAEIDTLDGVTIDCFRSHGWWCNVRKSNTEPLLRLNLEARTPETAQAMLAEIAPMLGLRVDH